MGMDNKIKKQVATVPHWYHRIALPDGSTTPGINDTAATLAIYDELGLPQHMKGLRVIDIGCSDGYYSFLAEKRGASEVIALDYRLPTATGFSVVKNILKSNVRHVVENVYNLDEQQIGKFDLVIFVGILYHLRNPLLALDRIRAIAKLGATVLVETHIIDPEIASVLLAAGLPAENLSKVLNQPLWQFYLKDSLNQDASNKWAPTLCGLTQICEESQLKVIARKEFGSRGAVLCRAISDADLEVQRKMDITVGLNMS